MVRKNSNGFLVESARMVEESLEEGYHLGKDSVKCLGDGMAEVTEYAAEGINHVGRTSRKLVYNVGKGLGDLLFD